ncbi:MAG: tetratricopeptide repeat protein [Akkermansiaceae bacterium]|nr:tetratricopeptide repeat protein [Armatimonadota bacterium]
MSESIPSAPTPGAPSSKTTPYWVVPAAVAFALACGAVGFGIAKSGQTGAMQAATASSGTPVVATPSPVADFSAESVLAAIADPGSSSAAAKEVVRWRDRAKARPEIAQLWVNTGDALMQLAREKVDPHDVDPAEKCYQRALSLDPKDPGATIGMAWIAGSRHRFPLSIEWAEKGIALMPRDNRSYGLVGDAYVELGDYDRAFDAYQKMIDVRPDITSYSRGAHILYLAGDTKRAFSLMAMAINAGSADGEDSAWCRAQLGEMLFDSGALLPAESALKTAMKLKSDNYYVLTAMGKVQSAQGNTKQAIALLEKAVAISPQHAALAALYENYVAAGRGTDAEKTFVAIETAADHHKTHGNADSFYLARFYADAGKKLPEALAIVRSKPETPNPVDADTAAWVYYKNGNFVEAKKHIDIALKKIAPDAARLYHAGMIYEKAGSPFEARKYLGRAVNKNSRFSPVHAPIAVATLQKLGKLSPQDVARNASK